MKQNLLWMVLAAVLLAPSEGYSQKKKESPEMAGVTPPADASKGKKVTIESKTKSCKKFDGLFTLYQDTTSGNVFILVKNDQLGKEFIYHSYSENGPASAGLFKGSFRSNFVFKVNKYFDRVEFVRQNTNFYFDKNNAVSKNAEANISNANFFSDKIIAEENGSYLLDATALFIGEKMDPVKPILPPGLPPGLAFTLGSLNNNKSKFDKIRSYPQNTDVLVELTYENPSPSNQGGNDITDARYVSVKIQHSFIAMPTADFTPRADDPRVGYFTQKVDDKTSFAAIPYKDVINHWKLVKKNPNEKLSEPVEPIVYWIENTTPVEYRETILEAGLKWNEAFEKAGFKNAIVMKIQPDTATWDAGDVRYNVIRWTSSPTPPFGAYGPSFVNPRTGQILGADIMVELNSIIGRGRLADLYDVKSSTQQYEEAVMQHDPQACAAGHYAEINNAVGYAALEMLGGSSSAINKEAYTKQFLYYLILHEMGHTLGLNHNMKASQMLKPSELNNTEVTRKIGLIGSVMDYPAVNISADVTKQGDYWTTKPGPYDLWAIEYGYTPIADPAQEKEVLNTILSRSTEPQLTFGNDADDMRSPGKAIDPRVMIEDLSGDAISYAQDRFLLIEKLQAKLKEKYAKPGQSYQEMTQVYSSMFNQYNNMAAAVSRYVGGVYVDRSFVGQSSTAKPYTAVPLVTQKKAMEMLSKYVFSPSAFSNSSALSAYLQQQRRGFDFFTRTEDPKIHTSVLNMQRNVLSHITHPMVLQRITDAKLYGNEYSVANMLNDLTAAVFAADMQGNVNTFRQNLQIEYVGRLTDIVEAKSPAASADNIATSAALYQLKKLRTQLAASTSTNEETKAHRSHLMYNIDKTLAVK